jgi:hypothetical protein
LFPDPDPDGAAVLDDPLEAPYTNSKIEPIGQHKENGTLHIDIFTC